MRPLSVITVAIAALAGSSCAEKHLNVKEVSVSDAANAFNVGGTVFVDANDDDFRKSNGTIPGSILLADSSYEPNEVLPANKSAPLVFYCSNRR
jgi:hypothetical protein